MIGLSMTMYIITKVSITVYHINIKLASFHNICSINVHDQVWFFRTKKSIIVKLTSVCAVNKWNVCYGIQEWEIQVVIVTICEFYCPVRFFNTIASSVEVTINQKCSCCDAANAKCAANSNDYFLLCCKSWKQSTAVKCLRTEKDWVREFNAWLKAQMTYKYMYCFMSPKNAL